MAPTLKKVEFKYIPLHEIKPYENNAKLHPVKQLQGLSKSIGDFNFLQPIVIDKNNVIVAGHGRYEAAAAIGMAEVPCALAEDLTEDQIKAYRLIDNELAKTGTDFDILQLEVASLPDFPFEDYGVEFPEIEKITEGLCDEDEVPAMASDPIAKLGDIWVLGSHRLMCGDSISSDEVDKLMEGKKADMVFTDPPYGISYQGKMRTNTPKFSVLENDDKILDIAPIVFLYLKKDAAAFVWTSHAVYPEWRHQFSEYYKNTIVWYKAAGGMGDLNGNYATDYELALFCVKGNVKFNNGRGMAVWQISKDPNVSYEHPTQKPVALAEKAIGDLTRNNHIILDLFGGSGSTLIACEKTGRKCFMMELAPNYCDVIIRRWQKFTGKKAILESTDQTYDEVSNV